MLILRYLILVPKSLPGRVLNVRLMVWLGQLSFAFYLVHQIVIFEVQKHIHSKIPVAVLSLAVSIPVAWALQRWVMTPATRLRQHMDARRAARPAAAAAFV